MKKKHPRMTLLFSALISAGLIQPAMALTEKEAKLPWQKQTLSAADYGGSWANVGKIYSVDLNGDKGIDIVRQDNSSGSGAVKELINIHPVKGTSSYTNTEKQHFYQAGKAGFDYRALLEHNNTFSAHGFDARQVQLRFGQFDSRPGSDMFRFEFGEGFADDPHNSANVFAGYGDSESITNASTFCEKQDMPFEFNGYYGAWTNVGDFNGDGFDDLLRTEHGDWSDDHLNTVIIYYGGQGTSPQNPNNCPTSDGKLGFKRPTSFVVDGNSEEANTNPQWLFDLDIADLLIGDFNGDGKSDIFRYDTGSTLSDHFGSSHSAVDIWFGMDNIDAKMQRKLMYVDTDGNRDYSTTDKHVKDFKSATTSQFRIGDFDGDGADDILRFVGNDMTVYLSKAVKATVKPDKTIEPLKRNLALFEEIKITDALSFNFDAGHVEVKVADFNQDGRDDILAFNGKPYILYSHIPQSQAGGSIDWTLVKHAKTINNNSIDTDGFNAARLGNKKLIDVADYSGDGYPDILYVPNNIADASLLLTPPYDPLQEIKVQQHTGQIGQMEGVVQNGSNMVFYNDNGTLKYMARNGHGWQLPVNVPFYSKPGDARCDQDLPVDGEHLSAALFEDNTPYGGARAVNLDQSKKYFAKPLCDTGYSGEVFDVVADNEYIYLFRASGSKILLDRFIYKRENNSLQRLIEARYKLTSKRYQLPSATVIGIDPSSSNSAGISQTIGISDVGNKLFYEPAFEVPFTTHAKTNGQYCQVGELTASVMADSVAGHRFLLASTCKDQDKIYVASVRQGEQEPFGLNHFTYEKDGSTINIPSIQLGDSRHRSATGAYLPVASLDSISFASSVVDDENRPISLDIEFLIASTGIDNGEKQVVLQHFPMTRYGGFHFSDSRGRRLYYSYPAGNAGKLTSNARLHYGNDGYVHLYWRGNSHDDHKINQLYEAVLDPKLLIVSSSGSLKPDSLYANWSPVSSLIDGLLDYSWPGSISNYNENESLTSTNLSRTSGSILKPPFGNYYESNSTVLGNNLKTPVVFEYGDLVLKDGHYQGILRRSFINAVTLDNQQKFVFSQQNLFDLIATYHDRVPTNLEMVGFIEGAPPVPKENLGRDQNGKWGYSADASKISLVIGSDTTVGAEEENSGGFKVDVTAGKNTSIPAIFDFKWYVNSSLTAEFNNGDSEEFTLGYSITRESFITGLPPSQECSSVQNPYQDACYKTESDGSKVELWQPDNEGAIFATSLEVDAYVLKHPKTNKLVGYQLDYKNATITQIVTNFNINPAYQVAGSLDGYIGNELVTSIPGVTPYRSYFKPRQERNWIDQDSRQNLELLERYNQAKSTTSGTSASEFVNDKLLIAKTAVADGACQTQESKAAASVTDYYGNSIDFSASVGFEYEGKISGNLLEAEVGGFYKRQFKQSKNNSQSITFTPGLSCDIASEVQGPNNVPLPWTVNSYSVRSYFLPASVDNYKDLFNNIIHPTNPGHATERFNNIMAQAKASPRKLWRIVHRVDAISRIMADPM